MGLKKTFLILVISLSYFGCAVRKDGELQKTSVRLLWLDQAQFAGIYVAQTKGYFAQEKLSVTIQPGGPDVSPILLVASGSNDFGIASGTDVILARSNKVPVVAVATIFQKNPVVFFAKREKKINSPRDFVGHSVGIKYGLGIEYYYKIMMKRNNIDIRGVKEIPIKFDLARFFAGEVDVWSGYAINEPVVAEEKGVPVSLIFCEDWGVPAVGDTIFTTEAMVKERPRLVESFLRAALKGWEDAIGRPDQGVSATLQANPSLSLSHEKAMLLAAIPLIKDGAVPLGDINPAKWRRMHEMMLESGLLKAPIDLQKAFTKEFIENIYGSRR